MEHDVINKGCLMYRMEKLERGQAKVQEFGKEVDKVLDNIDQRITHSLKVPSFYLYFSQQPLKAFLQVS